MGEDRAVGADAEARYEALRERFWELASIEGVSLSEFLDARLTQTPAPGPEALADLVRLVEDVEDTMLENIALKSQEEGGVYEDLADERIDEVQAERAALLDRLREAGAPI